MARRHPQRRGLPLQKFRSLALQVVVVVMIAVAVAAAAVGGVVEGSVPPLPQRAKEGRLQRLR
ncbi:hypothetical protein FA13DRAFT_1724741 [Coprinellus micaceus]|uniref:Uncharacterized protein n=1 Tax=Coprinellus micaceus TaxID=71717 RepID=A0A4Y7TX90_COPMI|nr:hypothetical protein FA13DRAFT_1724741 [Coprinellus micaceus]